MKLRLVLLPAAVAALLHDSFQHLENFCMLWFILFGLAIAGIIVARRLHWVDEIYGLAFYSASSLAALWGLMLAPSEAQISLGILTLGGVQLQARRARL